MRKEAVSSMRTLILILTLLAPAISEANPGNTDSIGGRDCRNGVHQQPHGPFAVYVFCDDAVGTNIAVFYSALGEPRFDKWTVQRRFWQDEPWSLDVHTLGWVPDRDLLVVTTSEIYGHGAVYLLDLRAQTFVILAEPQDCGAAILAIDKSSVTVGLNDCESPGSYKRMSLQFPKSK
jgi:hypothetical protein